MSHQHSVPLALGIDHQSLTPEVIIAGARSHWHLHFQLTLERRQVDARLLQGDLL